MRKARLARLKARYEAICKHWEEKPRDFNRVGSRLRDLMGRAEKTVYALKAKTKLEQVYDAQFKDCLARAKVFEDKGRFQDAYDVFNDLPLIRELSDKAMAEQKRIRALATDRFEVIRGEAWKKLGPAQYTEANRGDLKAAEDHLKTALALKMSHIKEAVEQEAAKLQAEHKRRLAELDKQLAAKRAEELKELRKKFDAERDRVFAEAVRIDSEKKVWKLPDAGAMAANRLLAAKFKPFAEEAGRIKRDLDDGAKLLEELPELIKPQIGKRVQIKGPKVPLQRGLLVGANRIGIGIRPQGMSFGSISHNYTRISVETLAKLTGLDGGSAAGAYRAGVFAFFSGRKGAAVKFLREAAKDKKHEADAKYYLSFAESQWKEEQEEAATALLDKCRKAFAKLKSDKVKQGDPRWVRLTQDLQRLQDEYGDTEVVKKNLGE
jgi:hypothetical protein